MASVESAVSLSETKPEHTIPQYEDPDVSNAPPAWPPEDPAPATEEEPAIMTQAFCHTVSSEEYDKQKSSTKFYLQELANIIRRNPSLAKKASRFQELQRPFRVRALLIRMFWASLALGVLVLLQQQQLGVTAPHKVQRNLPPALCGHAEATKSMLSGLVADQTGVIVFAWLGFMAFLTWIMAMHFESRQIEAKISVFQQAAWPIVDFVGRYLMFFTLTGIGIAAMSRFFPSRDDCLDESRRLADLVTHIPFADFWSGAVRLTLPLLNMFTNWVHAPEQYEFVAFLAFVTHLVALSYVWTMLVRMRSLQLADIVPALLFGALFGLVSADEDTERASHGQVLFIGLAAASLVRLAILALQTWLRNFRSAEGAVPLSDLVEGDDEEHDD